MRRPWQQTRYEAMERQKAERAEWEMWARLAICTCGHKVTDHPDDRPDKVFPCGICHCCAWEERIDAMRDDLNRDTEAEHNETARLAAEAAFLEARGE